MHILPYLLTRRTPRICVSSIALLVSFSAAQGGPLYWDSDGATAGGGLGTASGTWGVSTFWSTSSGGTSASTGAWVSGSDASFLPSGGTFANTAYTVTVSGSQFANSVTFSNNGTPTLAGTSTPALTIGVGGLNIGNGSSTSGIRGVATLDATLGAVTLAGSQNWGSNASSSVATFGLVVNAGVRGSAVSGGTMTLSLTNNADYQTVSPTANLFATYNGILSDGTQGGKLGLTVLSAGGSITTFAGANTFTGPLNLVSGTLTLNTLTGSFNSGVGASFLGTNTFNLNNTGAAAATSQTLAGANFSRGEGTFSTVQTAAQDVLLNLGKFTQAASATTNFNVAGTASATNGVTIAGQTAGIIGARTFFNAAVGGGGQNGQFAWYDGAGFVRGVVYGTDAGTFTAGAGATISGGTNLYVQATGATTAQLTDTFKTLNLSGAADLTLDTASSAVLTLSSGGLLKTGNTAATVSGGGGITTGGSAELVLKTDQATDAVTISTPILSSSTGGLTKGGAGNVTLSATANAYSGTTTVNQGSLILGASGVIPDASNVHVVGASMPSTTNNANQNASGGALNIGAFNETVGAVTLDGGSIVGTTGVLTGTSYDVHRGLITGILGGTGGLTKNETGYARIATNVQQYSGPTTINAGLLQIFNASTANLLNPASALVMGGGNIAFNSAANAVQTMAGLSLVSGDSTIAVTRNSNSMNVTLGAISSRATGSTVVYPNAGGSSVTLNITSTNTASGVIGGYFVTGALGGTDWARNSGTSGSSGSTLALAGGSYTNTATPTNATNLDMTASQTLTGSNVIGTVRFNSGSLASPTLTLGGATSIDSGGILVTANTQGNAASIAAGSITSGNGKDLIVIQNNPAGSLTISSTIEDNAGVPIALTKSGPGTLSIDGTNTFTGGVYLNNGVLQIGSAGALNTTTLNAINFGSASGNVANGGIVPLSTSFSTPILRLAGNSVSVASLSTANVHAGNPIAENASVTAATLTVNGSVSSTFAGNLQNGTGSGSLGLSKSGNSSLTLTGVNTYTGATTVNAGTLAVSGSLSGTTSISITGGTLQLGAADVINDASTVSLGGGTFATAGLSETVGALSLAVGTSMIDLGSGASVFHFADSSATTWTGTLSITNWSGLGAGGGTDQLFFGSTAGGLSSPQLTQIQFINPDGFAPGIYGATILAGGEVVALVPEPGVAVSLLGGVGLLVGLRRRRLA